MDSVRAGLGITKSVAYPLGSDEIPVVSCITHQRPPRTEWLAEVIRNRSANQFLLTLAGAHPFGEFRCSIEDLREVPCEILPVFLELRDRPTANDEGEAVICRPRSECAIAAVVSLEPVERQPAPVAVIAHLKRRLFIVLLGTHGASEDGVTAVGSNHDAGTLGDSCSAAIVSPNSGDFTIFDDDVLHGECLANFCAGLRCSIDKDLVEDRAARPEGDG